MSWTKRLRPILINTCLVFFSIALVLSGFELSLKAGLLDDLDNPAPVWIPPKYIAENTDINNENKAFSLENPFHFTDINRPLAKDKDHYRVAILGDSFIWGDGLPYKKTWSHKLEEKLFQKHSNIEVLHWGRNGWSTKDELEFLERFGKNYNIDYLIVGFVTNDPDTGETIRKDKFKLTWHNSDHLSLLKKALPLSFDFVVAHVNNLLMKHAYYEQSMDNWMDTLYSEKNLLVYRKTLNRFSEFCKSKKIPLIFVLTPRNYTNEIHEKYQQIIPLLDDAGISYLNLLPKVNESFKDTNIRKLWANPANGHPGELCTDLFAHETFKHLQKTWFKNTPPSEFQEKNPLKGASKVNKDSRLWLSKTGDSDSPKLSETTATNDRDYLFIEGGAYLQTGVKSFSRIFIRLNGTEYIEASLGPFYTPFKVGLGKTYYSQEKYSEANFKVHVKTSLFKKGINTVEFILFDGDTSYIVYPEVLKVQH